MIHRPNNSVKDVHEMISILLLRWFHVLLSLARETSNCNKAEKYHKFQSRVREKDVRQYFFYKMKFQG